MNSKSLNASQTMITVWILFTTVISVFFKNYVPAQEALVQLRWFFLVAFYLIIYVIILAREVDTRVLRVFLYLNLTLSAILIAYLSFVPELIKSNSQIQALLNLEFYWLALINSIILPILIFFLACFGRNKQ